LRLFYAIIIIALNSALVFGQEAEFSIDKSVHKFPKTAEGVLLEHNYTITNTGTVPLILSDYQVACSCTKAYLPIKPILPGEIFSLLVTFDTAGKYDFQDRVVNFKVNTKKGKSFVRFKVRVLTKE
tara:strand:+ start:12224 stop:12601 length:378 start_codon:yes stop_codon:yes gene_type:complete